MRFKGRAIDGRFYPFNPAEVTNFLLSLNGAGITVDIVKATVPKSNSQLNGLHFLIRVFTDELNNTTGNDLSDKEVKDLLKKKRNYTEDIFNVHTGEYIDTRLKSFSKLSLSEASEWITWLYAYSQTTFNITLPPLEPK